MTSKVSPTKTPRPPAADVEASSNISTFSSVPSEKLNFKVYKERWLVLATMVTLISSNITQWSSYSAIIRQTDLFHCGLDADTCKASFYANQIFQAMAVGLSVIGMYLATRCGILTTLRSCATANLLGAAIRLIASNPNIEDFTLRKYAMFCGTSITSIAQMYFVITTEVAESWFSPSNRASANVACTMSLTFGTVMGTLLPSLILNEHNEDPNTWNFFVLNSIITALCIIPLILSFIQRTSLPPTPPSVSFHDSKQVDVRNSILECFKIKQFIVQIIIYILSFGCVIVVVFLNDTINDRGYKYPITIATASSLFSAYAVGKFADRTKRFKEIVIISVCLLAVSSVLVKMQLSRERSCWVDDVIIILLFSTIMTCTASQIPIGQEIAVETTFPVHEAVSCAILNFFGQFWMLSIYSILDAMKQIDFYYVKSKKYGNWQLSVDLWVFLSCANAILAIFCLKPQYNRLKVENENSKNASEKE